MSFDGIKVMLFGSMMVLASSLTFPTFSAQHGSQLFQGQSFRPAGSSATAIRLNDIFLSRMANIPKESIIPSTVYQGIPRKRTTNNINGELTWGTWCSPSTSFITRHQDTALNCEALAPVGSTITWTKNNQQIQSLTDVANSHDLHRRSQRNVATTPENTGLNQLRGMAHYKTELLLPCVDTNDEGIYQLSIQIPHQTDPATRTFNVSLSGQRDTPGMSCGLWDDFQSMPHILVAAAMVNAPAGFDIKIPCQVTGQNIRVTWYFQESTLLPTKQNQEVEANGNLVIRQMTAADQGIYTCFASSTLNPQSIDHAHTIVRLQQ